MENKEINELIISLIELKREGSDFETGQLLKDKGIPMVLNGLSWEFDFNAYVFEMYYDDDNTFLKIKWWLK